MSSFETPVENLTATALDLSDPNVAETNFEYAGPGAYRYRILSEPHLSTELERIAYAKNAPGGVDVVSIQPCRNPQHRSEDRYFVDEWDLVGGKWVFMSVFDGHAGHETVDHAIVNIPAQVRSELENQLDRDAPLAPEAVSSLLSRVITAYDDSLTAELQAIFPGGTEELEKLSDDEIKARINDTETGTGINNANVLRCLRGTTLLLSLFDPSGANLWTASLGDCAAVLGRKVGQEWKVTVLSSNHNGVDAEEVARIKSEHPEEPEAILHDRVLGSLALTRAVGDHTFKLPKIWTTRVFLNCAPSYRFPAKVLELLPRNLTPPYVSNDPEVRHVSLSSPEHERSELFLIMASDGLAELYETQATFPQEIADKWVRTVAGEDERSGAPCGNLALKLLRSAMGGDDVKRVSAFLTADMDIRNMDDTTILVRRV